MELRVAQHTDQGVMHETNQDSSLASPPLVAVADGVGGHNAGEIASALAVDVLREWLPTLTKDGAAKLKDAAKDANSKIYSKAQTDTALAGMATTLTAAWIEKGSCTLAHIGDSRAYLFRDGELSQITEDQTFVAELVRQGRITPEEAYDHPWRNRVLQALGGAPEVVVEMFRVDLQVADKLLLASDGLTDMLRDAQIRDVLADIPEAEQACRALVARAKATGTRDDVTVVLVEVTSEDNDRGVLRRLFRR